MFITQIYGTILGGFLNYAVMISIVSDNAELLANGNGNSSWSGATIQSYNTNASSWALAKYLYKAGKTYAVVPYGVAIGAAFVVVHRIFAHVRITHSDPSSMLSGLHIHHCSSFPRSASSPPTISTCLNCLPTLVTSLTTNRRLVFS